MAIGQWFWLMIVNVQNMDIIAGYGWRVMLEIYFQLFAHIYVYMYSCFLYEDLSRLLETDAWPVASDAVG